MAHIDEFNRACGLIFAALYEHFPVPIDLGRENLGFGSDRVGHLDETIVSETFDFLCEDGYIRFDRETSNLSLHRQVRLTSKGLGHLQRIPRGVHQSQQSLIEQIQTAIRAHDEVDAKALRRVLSLIFA